MSILTNIFQMGWNHQLEDRFYFLTKMFETNNSEAKKIRKHPNLHSESLFT